MGFFDRWNVSGITTKSAQNSRPFYELAQVVKYSVESNEISVPIENVLETLLYLLKMKNNFNDYTNHGVERQKTDAVKFLVIFIAYSMGSDETEWDWEQIRHISQGLYGSLINSPDDFMLYNLPLIEDVVCQIELFLKKCQEIAFIPFNIADIYENNYHNYYHRDNGRNKLYWYKLAAGQGDVESQYQLAKIYDEKSSFIKMNKDAQEQLEYGREALKLYKLAAEQGHRGAINSLINIYGHGRESLACSANSDEVDNLHFLHRRTTFNLRYLAEETKDIDSKYNLGCHYAYETENKEAAKWYLLAANEGCAKAQYALGDLFSDEYYTEGVTKNLNAALKWYKLAAKQGHLGAKFKLSNIYSSYGTKKWTGIVTEDYDEEQKWKTLGENQIKKETFKWFQLAAEQGHTKAKIQLAELYSEGRGVAKNKNEALKWYKLAAEQGDGSAQYRLGYMYSEGVGVQKDEKEANKWLSLPSATAYSKSILVFTTPRSVYDKTNVRDDPNFETIPDELRTFCLDRGLSNSD